MKRLAVAFTGPSNSGKTTLIEKIAQRLIAQNYKVKIIKNDPKDKAKFDIEGKDSYKFFQTGADVIVTSPTRTTYFQQDSLSFDDLVALAGDFDYLLVEGLKTLPLPRIAIFRNELNSDYFEVSDVLAVDESIAKNELAGLQYIDLNNPDQAIEWIDVHAQKM